ncbi:hypothetical protein GXP67_35070 [Rhodocytophaga rosea]|uniref:Uncharacterized protein n=1 Tax=Rhodocytophaga rosea TaxID=2704465 RepID=A0A6C0GTM4_9BACT|nr:hypothetical protein [Rhodocytophaga rosea]QHT71515.1 hypothetical protein GXP67_35070 [Rhodocytophaga rosea]
MAHRKSYTAFFLVFTVVVHVLSFDWVEIESFIYVDRLPAQYPIELVNQGSTCQYLEVISIVLHSNPGNAKLTSTFPNNRSIHCLSLLSVTRLAGSKALIRGIDFRPSSHCYTYRFNIPHQNADEDEVTSCALPIS